MENENNIKLEAETQEVKPASIYDELFKEHTLKLDIGAVTKSGKFTIFDNLKKYDFKSLSGEYTKYEDYKYLIYEYNDQNNKPSDKDLDDYRSLVTQPYNIYSSKVSGNLALIAELCQFNDFDLSIKNLTEELTEKDDDNVNTYKIYNPTFNFGYEGDYEHIPYGAECHFEMTWEKDYNNEDKGSKIREFDYHYVIDGYEGSKTYHYDDDDNNKDSDYKNKHDFQRYNQLINNKGLQYEFDVDGILSKEEQDDDTKKNNDIWEKLIDWAKQGYFEKDNRNTGAKIRYEVTPSMNWGKVEYLKITGEIDLDKISTGYINLSTWKYYNSDTLCTLVWGLDIYEETGFVVDSVEMDLLRIVSVSDNENDKDEYGFPTNDIQCEILHYDVGTRESWFGIFTENIPLDQDYSKIQTEKGKTIGQLKSNQLYLARICVYYVPTKDVGEHENREAEVRVFYRFLYTCGIFNKNYQTIRDYVSLHPDFNLGFSSEQTITQSVGTITQLGILRTIDTSEESLDKNSSFSAIQNNYDIRIDGDIIVDLENNYNGMFYVDVSKNNNLQTTDSIFIYNDNGEEISVDSGYSYNSVSDIDIDKYLSSDYKNLGACDEEEYENYIIKNNREYDDGEDLFFYYNEDGTSELKPTSILRIANKQPLDEIKVIDNKIHFDWNYQLLQTIKGYATKKETVIRISSYYSPIAYNKFTFDKYNLEFVENPLVKNEYKSTSGVTSEEWEKIIELYDNEYNMEIPQSSSVWVPRKIGLWGGTESKYIGKKTNCRTYYHGINREEKISIKSKGVIARKLRLSPGQIACKRGRNERCPFGWQLSTEVASSIVKEGTNYGVCFQLYHYGFDYYESYDWECARMEITPLNEDMKIFTCSRIDFDFESGARSQEEKDNVYEEYIKEINDSKFLLLLTMKGKDNSDCCNVPINFAMQFKVIVKNMDDVKKLHTLFQNYPGELSYFGFPHLFAQILSNIYTYFNDEISQDGYIVDNYFWNNEYSTTINIGFLLEGKSDEDVQNRAFYLVLDNGKVLLSDFLDYIKRDNRDFCISGTNNAEIDPSNITHNLYLNSPYELTITLKETDDINTETLRQTLKSYKENIMDCAILDYDGQQIIGFSEMSGNSGTLYVLGSDNNMSLASNFRPYKMTYSKDGVCLGPRKNTKGNNILLDQAMVDNKESGYDLNKYFTFDDTLKLGIYTTDIGDVQGYFQHLSPNDGNSDEGYTVTGLTDTPILPSFLIF